MCCLRRRATTTSRTQQTMLQYALPNKNALRDVQPSEGSSAPRCATMSPNSTLALQIVQLNICCCLATSVTVYGATQPKECIYPVAVKE